MQANQMASNQPPEDQDIDFDMHESSTTATSAKPDDTGSGAEKEDILGRKQFKPLSSEEKEPKLQDDERIKEMNRRTAIDD